MMRLKRMLGRWPIERPRSCAHDTHTDRSIHPKPPPNTNDHDHEQDLWAAILFIAHIGLIVYIAFVPGLKALRSGDLTKSGG
jgi:hypothetical protein